MKPCLVDVNVWLALLLPRHEHHRAARVWYETLRRGEAGMCRFVQLALIRLLANPSVLGPDVLTVRGGFDVVAALLEDERVELVREPQDLDAVLPRHLDAPLPAGKLVADAYLASFAECARLRLVTFDRALAKRAGVEVLQRK